jgi:archaellum component FlaC
MKHIKKFNENINNDAMYAIADSFNKVKQELDLLNKRLDFSAGKSEELDEFGSEISQMKINFDELLSKFNDFDSEFFGR